VITFSLATYTALHRIAAHDSSVTSLQFDPDSDLLVTASNDGRVKLWELGSGRWMRDLNDPSMSALKVGCVWKEGYAAVMCKKDGKTVVEVWSMRPKGKEKGKDRDRDRVR
jgi:F-box and WD-40 domain protein CDC4